MSSGKVHATTTIVLATISLPILVWIAVKTGILVVFMIPGILLGILITPDLDIDNRIVSHRYMRNWLGRPIGYLWYYFWHSYSISFKHRSVWSHAPVISTLVRLTFILFPPIIVILRDQRMSSVKLIAYLLLSTLMAVPLWGAIYLLIVVAQINIVSMLFLVLGLMLADLLHYIMDLV